MEPPAETACPDNFEVQISDDIQISDSVTEPKSSGDVGFGNKVDSTGNGTTEEHGAALLQASLSDVVLSQSLQSTERSIDFGEADESVGEKFVDHFDSVVVDGTVNPENGLSLPEKNACQEEEVRVNMF